MSSASSPETSTISAPMAPSVSISSEWSVLPGPVVTILKRATCCLLRQFGGTLAQSCGRPTTVNEHACAQECADDRRRPVARPDAAQARGGLPEAAEHRPAVRRGRDLPQSFHPGRALRSGARQPADRPVPDESPRGAEHHSAVLALHQPGARAAARRLRSRAGRLHDHDARSAPDRAQRSALLRAGRHHGRLPLGRRLREPRRLFRLGGRAGLRAAEEPRRCLAAAR